ncbi:MAG TPA: DoxX family protein [Vicinamibacterales bacterium]|nr:DoxX family protein [Vicinamibacterales bacterium]
MNTYLDTLKPWILVAGRVLIAAIFVTAGWSKIGGYEGTQQYMQAMGVPGALLPLVIFAELGGGLAIVLGLLTRLAAAGLAVFCVASAFLFHGAADQVNQIMFMKNIAIAGGLLFLVAEGAGTISLDARLFKRS